MRFTPHPMGRNFGSIGGCGITANSDHLSILCGSDLVKIPYRDLSSWFWNTPKVNGVSLPVKMKLVLGAGILGAGVVVEVEPV